MERESLGKRMSYGNCHRRRWWPPILEKRPAGARRSSRAPTQRRAGSRSARPEVLRSINFDVLSPIVHRTRRESQWNRNESANICANAADEENDNIDIETRILLGTNGRIACEMEKFRRRINI